MKTLSDEKITEINQAVNGWLRTKGITHGEAARRLGVSVSSVNNQLACRHFSAKSARKWSAEFGLSEDFLLKGEGPVTGRHTGYQKLVLENEVLRGVIMSQKRTIEKMRDRDEELERYRLLYGPLPQVEFTVQRCVNQ